MKLAKISFISAHFFDHDWTANLVRQIEQFTPPEVIHEILLINQDRTEASRLRLEGISRRVRVLEYPVSKRHVDYARHDHAAVMQSALFEATGDWICLFDSDAFPTRKGWLANCEKILSSYDAILAADPRVAGHTHPCFMMFPTTDRVHLQFDDGLFTPDCVDTGRLVGNQFLRAGHKPFIAKPTTAFSGMHGDLFLDGSIYHHNKGSFTGVSDPLVARQVTWENTCFKRIALHGYTYFPAGIPLPVIRILIKALYTIYVVLRIRRSA